MEFIIREFIIMEFVVKEFIIRESGIKEYVIRESAIMEHLTKPLAINWLDYYDWMWKLIAKLVVMEDNMVLTIYVMLKKKEDKTKRHSHREWETMVILDPNFMDFN